MKRTLRIMVMLFSLIVMLTAEGCIQNHATTEDPLKDYESVNRTYPVETVIYGTAYGANFTEVRYNDSGYGQSVSDISANMVDFCRVNQITIIYTDDNESYLRWDFKTKIAQYPVGIYTLYLARSTVVQGTTTEFHSGGHVETASTTIVYQRK